MENEFKEVMSERTDRELIKIATLERNTYKPIAIIAAEKEMELREIEIDKNEYLKTKKYLKIEKEERDNLEKQINDENKKNATNNMLYGALWCTGGIVASVADFGYIFWGAIVFGGIQFFKGTSNL